MTIEKPSEWVEAVLFSNNADEYNVDKVQSADTWVWFSVPTNGEYVMFFDNTATLDWWAYLLIGIGALIILIILILVIIYVVKKNKKRKKV